MVFSNSSTNQGLYQEAQFFCGVSNNDYLISDFTRNANRWYYNAVIEVWKSQDVWRFDDLNQTGSNNDDVGKPIAISSLTNSTRTYSLPTNALKIRRVEVLGQDGIWHKLRPYNENDIGVAEAEFYKTDGRPLYYVLEGDGLRLFPAPDNGVSVTLTNGLRVFFDREVDEFTTTDTTQEPGLPEPFHRIISLGAAYDFAIAKGQPVAPALKQELLELMQSMRVFFSERSNKKPRIQPFVRRDNYR